MRITLSPQDYATAFHLLTKTAAEYILVGPEPALQELAAAAFTLLREQGASLPHRGYMPVFEDLYNDAPVDALPALNADFDDPTVMMHSSGSTAFPKPITWTHYRQLMCGRMPCTSLSQFLGCRADRCWHADYGEQDLTGVRVACHTLAVFHAMGILQLGFVVCIYASHTKRALTHCV